MLCEPNEKPSDLVSNTERGISQITTSAIAETATGLLFMTDQLEQIAEPVQLHFELNYEHRQRKWPCVGAPSDKDDVPC